MRRRVENKTYDTEKSVTLGSCDMDGGLRETLMVTARGRYFVYVRSEKAEEIRPITRADARKWCMRNVGCDLDDLLSDEGHEGKTKLLGVRIPERCYLKVRSYAAERGMSMADVVTEMIEGLEEG